MIQCITCISALSNRNKTTKPMKRVSLTFDPDYYAAIDRLAQKSNVSASCIIRRSMREFLDHHRGDELLEIPLTQDAP